MNEGLTAQGDELPWISMFINWVLEQAGIKGTGSPRARSWLSWGTGLETPRPGCVAVFRRNAADTVSGSVGFYLSETPTTVITVMGNSANAVRLTATPKANLLGCRWPA